MRRSHWINLGMVGFLLASPFIAHAASTALTSIIPGASSGSVCLCPGSAPDWGCVLQTLQNIMNDVVGVAAIIISLFIAQAGFTYMTSGGNPEKRQLANKRILNAVIGLVIVLCAWLLVDSIMKVIYNPNAPLNGSTFGPWNSILVSNGSDYCIKQQTAPGALAALTQSGTPAQLAAGGTVPPGSGKGGTAQCASSNAACSVSALQSAGLSSAQAQAMSCIAMSESSGNPNTPNSPTGACGTFQITTQPGNWSNPAYHTGSCSVNTSCNDQTCNMQTAILMYQHQGFQPWTGINSKTGQPWNPTAVSCVNNFDPNGN